MAKTLTDEAGELSDTNDAKRIRELERQLAQEKSKREQLEREAKQLSDILDHQSAIIERKAAKLFRSPKVHAGKGFFHRVNIPDTHGAHIDPRARAAFLADLEYLRPKQIVWGGDHVDCGGFLAEHHTIGFVAEMAYSYVDDLAEANSLIDDVQKRAPDAAEYMVCGNHEHRIERWCCTHARGDARTAALLFDKLGVPSNLHLAKRGIRFIGRGDVEPNLRIRGALKLGCCYFIHDVSTARNAAQVAINKFGANVSFCDTHRFDMAISRKADRDIIAVTNGCLSTLRPFWQETNVTDWSHGYGVQIVAPDGEFLHIFVPIIDGKSLLGPLLGRVK
jgi:hypothetical protein